MLFSSFTLKTFLCLRLASLLFSPLHIPFCFILCSLMSFMSPFDTNLSPCTSLTCLTLHHYHHITLSYHIITIISVSSPYHHITLSYHIITIISISSHYHHIITLSTYHIITLSYHIIMYMHLVRVAEGGGGSVQLGFNSRDFPFPLSLEFWPFCISCFPGKTAGNPGKSNMALFT
jgi:hypothetical protein